MGSYTACSTHYYYSRAYTTAKFSSSQRKYQQIRTTNSFPLAQADFSIHYLSYSGFIGRGYSWYDLFLHFPNGSTQSITPCTSALNTLIFLINHPLIASSCITILACFAQIGAVELGRHTVRLMLLFSPKTPLALSTTDHLSLLDPQYQL